MWDESTPIWIDKRFRDAIRECCKTLNQASFCEMTSELAYAIGKLQGTVMWLGEVKFADEYKSEEISC